MIRVHMRKMVAVGTILASVVGGSIVASYVSPIEEAVALTPYQNLAQHKQQQARLQAELAGVNSQLSRLVLELNDLVNNQIPAAQQAATAAQDAAASAAQLAQETTDRLTAAQNDKATLEDNIRSSSRDYDEASATVAQVARQSFHGTSASKTFSVVTGSANTKDFIESMQSDAAVSRVEAKRASQSAAQVSTSKNRVDRLKAIEKEISALKVQADNQAAAAATASAEADKKVASLGDLRAQANAKQTALEQQKSGLNTAAAQEAAAIVLAQAQVDNYNRQLAAQAAAQAAAAAARRNNSGAQYTGGQTSQGSGGQAPSVSPGGLSYAVPGNCGPRDTVCNGHRTGRTAVLGGAYPWSECTWYAYNRRTALGLPVGSYMGNGGQWADTGRRLGYVVNRTPHVGAAIVFRPGQLGSSLRYGHVAIVERINANGSILISECGAVYRGNVVTRTVYNPGLYEYVHY